VEAAAADGPGRVADAEVRVGPPLRRAVLRPILQQAGFLRDVGAVRSLPLRPVVGGRGQRQGTEAGSEEKQQTLVHPLPQGNSSSPERQRRGDITPSLALRVSGR